MNPMLGQRASNGSGVWRKKSARVITDQIFRTIQNQAEKFADERARRLGLSRVQLVTPPEMMIEEFPQSGEPYSRKTCRVRAFGKIMPLLKINDVAGIKVIVEDDDYPAFLSNLITLDNCDVVEEERHEGLYNAINLIVKIRPPLEKVLAGDLSDGRILNILMKRGPLSTRSQCYFSRLCPNRRKRGVS